MSNIPQGRKARYLIGTPLADIAGLGAGLDRLTRGLRYEAQRLGGLRGHIASQLTPWRDYSHSFACASNTIHDPLLQAALGAATPWAYEPTAGSGNRVSGNATMIPSLSLDPRSNRAAWTVRMESDGKPATAAASADTRTPGITEAHQATMTAITYTPEGGAALDLTPLWESALTIQGLVNTDRRRVVPTGAATAGLTSDSQDIGYQPALGLRYDTAIITALEASPEGTLQINRIQPAWRYILPVILTSIEEEAPSAGALTLRCQFEPSSAGLPVVEAIP